MLQLRRHGDPRGASDKARALRAVLARDAGVGRRARARHAAGYRRGVRLPPAPRGAAADDHTVTLATLRRAALVIAGHDPARPPVAIPSGPRASDLPACPRCHSATALRASAFVRVELEPGVIALMPPGVRVPHCLRCSATVLRPEDRAAVRLAIRERRAAAVARSLEQRAREADERAGEILHRSDRLAQRR